MAIHKFNIKIAEKYDIPCAIILYNLSYWQLHNKQKNINFHDDKYWTYNSISEFQKVFTYLSQKQLERIFKKLRDLECVAVGCYNKSKIDRTKWYSVNQSILDIHCEDKEFPFSQSSKSRNELLEIEESIIPNKENDFSKEGNGFTEIGRPIPDNKPVKKTNNKKQISKKEFSEPSYEDFESYALEKAEKVDLKIDLVKLKLKYQSWKENDWYNGHGRKIKNWKTTLNNTLPYLKQEENEKSTSNQKGVSSRKQDFIDALSKW